MNPYLKEVQSRLCPSFRGRPEIRRFPRQWRPGSHEEFVVREDLARKYAWAVPNDEAISAIAKLSPIVEMGAGNGYWADLLRKAGATVHAYDDMSWPDQTARLHSEVMCAGPAVLDFYTTTWTLFLCWPPYASDMALRCLKQFRGTRFAYIGEGEGGCNGTNEFFELLGKEWTTVVEIDIPQWEGINDYLTIYERKKK